MSIVVWKVLETKVASDEEDILHRRLKARLERLTQESAVPIGAHWDNPPQEEPANRPGTALLARPSEQEMKLLAPAAESEFELVMEEHEPAQDEVDEPVVAVEERQAPPATRESTPLRPQPRPVSLGRDVGPRVTRAVARPQTPTRAAPLRAVAVKPAEGPLPVAGRRTTVRTTPSS